jgi:hypothetical protein
LGADRGHTTEEAAETTCFVPRWIEELCWPATTPWVCRRWAIFVATTVPSVLKPELLAKLKVRLDAGELGVAKVGVQRGWEALKAIGWSIQSPRPRNPHATNAEGEAAYKKTRRHAPAARSSEMPCRAGVGTAPIAFLQLNNAQMISHMRHGSPSAIHGAPI